VTVITTEEWRYPIQLHVAVFCINYMHILSFSSMSHSEVKLGASEVKCGCDEKYCLVIGLAQMFSKFIIAHVPWTT